MKVLSRVQSGRAPPGRGPLVLAVGLACWPIRMTGWPERLHVVDAARPQAGRRLLGSGQ